MYELYVSFLVLVRFFLSPDGAAVFLPASFFSAGALPAGALPAVVGVCSFISCGRKMLGSGPSAPSEPPLVPFRSGF